MAIQVTPGPRSEASEAAGAGIFPAGTVLKIGTRVYIDATGALIHSTGTIDGVAIGGTTPAPGAFTTLSAQTALTIGYNTLAATASFTINGASGQIRRLLFQSAGLSRFGFGLNTAPENGTSVGSDFEMYGFDDAGNLLGTVLRVARSTGTVLIDTIQTQNGTITGTTVGVGGAAAGAFTTLAAASLTVTTPLGISSGGTGAATASGALAALGGVSRATSLLNALIYG